MFNSLTEKQIFFNSKQVFSFIFCNVAKNRFQKIRWICEYDRFFHKSYSFVSFSVLQWRTILYTMQERLSKKPHFTAFLPVFPCTKNVRCA